MSCSKEIESWALKMGYTGRISQNLETICNPSTLFIWQQLITRAKPINQVKDMRKRLVIKALADESDSSIPETKLLKKRQALEAELQNNRREIAEKESSINDITTRNKSLYQDIAKLKARRSANELSNVVFHRKNQDLSEKLNVSRSLASLFGPLEASNDSTTETIERCVSHIRANINAKEHRKDLGLLNESVLSSDSLLDENFLHKSVDSTKDSIMSERYGADVRRLLKECLSSLDKVQFMSTWKVMLDDLLTKTTNDIKMFKMGEIGYVEAYFAHIKVELEKERLGVEMSEIESRIQHLSDEIYTDLKRNLGDSVCEKFGLQIREVGLAAGTSFLRQLIDNQSKAISQNESEFIELQIEKIKMNFAAGCAQREFNLENLQQVIGDVKEHKAERLVHFERFECSVQNPHLQDKARSYEEVELCKEVLLVNADRGTDTWGIVPMAIMGRTQTPFLAVEKSIERILSRAFLHRVWQSTRVKDLDSYESKDFPGVPSDERVEEVINRFIRILHGKELKEILQAPSKVQALHMLWEEKPWDKALQLFEE